jgi:hypothetical protein
MQQARRWRHHWQASPQSLLVRQPVPAQRCQLEQLRPERRLSALWRRPSLSPSQQHRQPSKNLNGGQRHQLQAMPKAWQNLQQQQLSLGQRLGRLPLNSQSPARCKTLLRIQGRQQRQ